MQLAGNGKPVPAVISLAANNHDPLFAYRRKVPGNILHHARGGILHQNDAWNAGLDGGLINLAHLERGEDLARLPIHASPRAITTVISSGSSGAVLQWATASMIFATISFGSLFWCRSAVSARRSTPNSSP